MGTLRATIPDNLQRQVQDVTRACGILVRLLVEQALRCVVAPEPFAGKVEAEAEIEALQADVLKDRPWYDLRGSWRTSLWP
jgi:hypothetical protein